MRLLTLENGSAPLFPIYGSVMVSTRIGDSRGMLRIPVYLIKT